MKPQSYIRIRIRGSKSFDPRKRFFKAKANLLGLHLTAVAIGLHKPVSRLHITILAEVRSPISEATIRLSTAAIAGVVDRL
jgi:hypothetical protein